MLEAHPTEQAVGMSWYVTEKGGIGGRLRDRPEDFRVREIERFDVEPLDANGDAYPDLVFRATLRGWDTNDFAGALSNRLGISRERVSWAGTKDKHAVTTQLFSVRDVDPASLRAAAGSGGERDSDETTPAKEPTDAGDPTDEEEPADGDEREESGLDGVAIDLLGRAGRSIEFGDLVGNRFRVVVRDADAPERLPSIVDELATWTRSTAPGEGRAIAVPNYFGQQRFGSLRPITHEVGLSVLRGDWRDAVRTYVADAFESEPVDTRTARERAGDAFDDRDWSGALDALPDRLGYERSMLHTLVDQKNDDESAAFRAALEAVPSSLRRLFVNAAQSFAFNRILSERLDRGLPFDRPVEGDVVCFADRDAPDDLVLPDVDRQQSVTEDRVSSITRHCERGRAFVTAPLVGTETSLAHGEPGEIERSVLEELGLTRADFALPDSWASSGTRRAILVSTALDVDLDPPTLAFSLPKGSYATVLLRECCKIDPVNLG
jgi:tRNA pseudouridine13 synthase